MSHRTPELLGPISMEVEKLRALAQSRRQPFKLVYQGGHHNVYCDGTTHIWTSGGFTEMQAVHPKRIGRCDCERWREVEP